MPGVDEAPGALAPGVSSLWAIDGTPLAAQPGLAGLPFWPLSDDEPLEEVEPLVEDVALLLALPVPFVPAVPVPEVSEPWVLFVVPVLPDAPIVPDAPVLAPAPLAPALPATPPPAPPAPPPPPPPAAGAIVVPATSAAAARKVTNLRCDLVSGFDMTSTLVCS